MTSDDGTPIRTSSPYGGNGQPPPEFRTAKPSDKAQDILEGRLPVPHRERWQPLRAGLLNIFLFQDERFPFADGRLLLRGVNATGKSRVMAFLLPFLLDGSLHPTRMEPDREAGRQVAWNLLMGEHHDRVGYTWLELGRLDDSVGVKYLTLGCGLKAVKDRGIVEHWFFMTSRRIDDELCLVTRQQTALTRRQLADALGDKGQIFERAGDYKRSVDEALFRLGDRYEHLLDLLLCLRQPQLAKKLDLDHLESALKESLPPLAGGLLDMAAETFRSLDTDRRQIQSSRDALARTTSFLEPYRQHVRVGLRRAADAVRSANGAFETAGRRFREAAELIKQLELESSTKEGSCRQAEEEALSLEARLGALERSDEARAAGRLYDKRQLVEAAKSAQERLRNAHEAVKHQWQHHADQVQKCERQVAALRDDVLQQLRLAEKVAAPEDLARTHREQLQGIGNREDLSEECVKEVIESCHEEKLRWLRHANRLVEFNDTVRGQKEQWLHARRSLDLREHEHAELSSRAADEATSVTRVRDGLWQEITRWRDGATELLSRIDDLEVLWPTWRQWAELADGNDPVQVAVDEAMRQFTMELAAEEAAAIQRDNDLKMRRGELEELLERLHGGMELGPLPPATRDPLSRVGQSGAPFWQVVDFAASLPASEHAGWEAALEASGLLDAWLMPDGQLRDGRSKDTFLIVAADAPLPFDRQLSRVLVPVDTAGNQDLAVEVVEAVLARIGVGTGASRIWVDRTGHWQNGPLVGHWEKQDAQFVGPLARHRHRQRKIQETLDDLASLAEQEAALATDMARFATRRRQVEEERQRFPSAEALRRGLADLASAERQVAKAATRLAENAQREQREHEKLDSLIAERDGMARDMDLVSWAERPEELVKRLDEYAHELRHLERALRDLVAGIDSLQRARAQHEGANSALESSQSHLRQSELETHQHEVELQTLIETIGTAAAEITRLLAESRQGLLLQKEQHRKLQREASDVGANLIVRRQQIDGFQAEIRARDEQRREAIEHLQMRASRGLFEVADLGIEPPPVPWSLTQGVELARGIERSCQHIRSDDDAWQRSQTRVHTLREELRAYLSSHDVSLEPESLIDGMQLVHVPFRGTLIRIDQLVQQLAEEFAAHEQILSEKERQIFEDFLLGEVGSELHRCMHEAAELVESMTSEVAQRPMSTGMQMRFQWELGENATPELHAARDILMRMRETWSAEEREALIRFLQRQIQQEQARDQAGSWSDHLRVALDYRQWHALRIERRSGEVQPWKRLTRNTYAVLSGGEKAIALTIPQCAAAAAYYRSAHEHAPRFLLLDEAFAGISTDNRGGCLELLVSFDLDVLMTSENERGCYPAVPALAICRLSRASDLPVVLNDVFVWNGVKQAGPAVPQSEVELEEAVPGAVPEQASFAERPIDGRLF